MQERGLVDGVLSARESLHNWRRIPHANLASTLTLTQCDPPPFENSLLRPYCVKCKTLIYVPTQIGIEPLQVPSLQWIFLLPSS